MKAKFANNMPELKLKVLLATKPSKKFLSVELPTYLLETKFHHE